MRDIKIAKTFLFLPAISLILFMLGPCLNCLSMFFRGGNYSFSFTHSVSVQKLTFALEYGCLVLRQQIDPDHTHALSRPPQQITPITREPQGEAICFSTAQPGYFTCSEVNRDQEPVINFYGKEQ